MSKKIVVIDYEMSNTHSVLHAISKLGFNPILSRKKNEILNSDFLILPGVGAYKAAMNNLKRFDLIESIKEFVNSGKPLMGVCLGFQLLFDYSEEFGKSKGLGLIPGSVKRFPQDIKKNEKVPQINWNRIKKFSNVWETSPLKKIDNEEWMYFIHSFYVIPKNKEIILSTTNYNGIKYCSSILMNNIFATQFHPEKSGNLGLSIYKNWILGNNG